MAQKNIRDIRGIIFNSLQDNNLGRALAQLKILATAAHLPEVFGIETTYKTMLKYMFDNVNDPDRDNVYNNLIKRSYELTDDVCSDYMPVNYSQNETFSALWNVFRYNEQQIEYCKQLTEEDNELKLQIAVSAVTLNCLRILDETKLNCLIEFCSNKNRKVKLRALTGLILCLIKHDRRIVFYPAINNGLNLLFLNADNVSLAQAVILQFLRCKQTPKISEDIKNNIIPTLSEFGSKIKTDMEDNQNNFDRDDFETEYKIQDMIEESGISDKMQTYGEMQAEGFDINMSTFSQLKSFMFFQNIDNWFMPFYKENPEISALFANQSMQSLSMIIDNEMLCDSDKYSFCLNLLRIPEQMRSQAAMQLPKADDVSKADNAGVKDIVYLNNYVHDIYRFFKLFRDKDRFDDIFGLGKEICTMEFFRFIDTDGKFLPKLAEFYFKSKLYEEAITAYKSLLYSGEIIDDVNKINLYKYLAYCHEQRHEYTEARYYYGLIRNQDSSNINIIKKLAFCNKKLREYSMAMQYYRKVEAAEPENLNVLFNIGFCLTHLQKFEEAVKYFYKIEFYEPETTQSGQFDLCFGYCLWAIGDKKQAVQHFEKFSKSTANNKEEGSWLTILEDRLYMSSLDISKTEIYNIIDYIRYFATFDKQ